MSSRASGDVAPLSSSRSEADSTLTGSGATSLSNASSILHLSSSDEDKAPHLQQLRNHHANLVRTCLNHGGCRDRRRQDKEIYEDHQRFDCHARRQGKGLGDRHLRVRARIKLVAGIPHPGGARVRTS